MKDLDKDLLAELLIQWEELYERGQDTPAAELAKDHPELIAELERRIKVLKKVAWLDKPLDGDSDDPPSENDPRSPFPRTIAGRYRLDELIAEGGFAQVFRAYDKELQRTVAVKVPKPSKLESNDTFLAEARRAARLKHDGIVPVHDVGTDGDTVFIVSEYLEGGSLADRLTQGKIDPDDAVRWVTEIADALEYAHLNGVIHRDIKPANIVIDHHGRAKLTDFGIAQSASKTGSFAPSLGTLRYMAPEQLQGTSADHRSDIYSLAVVLYEALTGRVPYSSFEPNVLRREIVGRPTALEGLPHHLRPICEKALNKSPHQRQSSATQFASELRKATPMNRWLRVLVTLPLVVGIIAVCYFLLPFRTDSTSVKTPTDESEPHSDFEYTLSSEGATITRYDGHDTDIVIPAELGGRSVVAIGSDAFNGRHFIRTIRFPKTILGIGNASFAGCNDLQSLELPPQLRHIGFNAFQFCTVLKQVEIPASVTRIGAVCFFGCRNLEAINVHPANIQYASVEGILYDKEVQTLIACPAGKKGVVEIPDLVTGIQGWSFAGCDMLTRITIPKSVTEIHKDAFRDCDAVREVVEPPNPNLLTTLSARKARDLVRHPGGLALNALTTLSDEAAEELRNYNGWISLNSLTSLSDNAAAALATGRGNLHFDRLKTMSDEAARSLSQRWGNLVFNGLTSLSDGAAEAFAQHKVNFLYLNGLTEISPTAAKALSRHQGALVLDGLKSLTTEVAQALANHKNQLYLNGVTTISPEAAKALEQHKGPIYLKGLTTLSDEASETLRANPEIHLPDKFNKSDDM